MEGSEVRVLLDDLAASQATFHGWAPDVEVNWALNQPALDLLVELVADGQRTLETGVGYSTVVFAALGAQHTVVSPLGFEHDRVQQWCVDRDIDLAKVSFVAAPSQAALPALGDSPLDLVLIDGDHAFPSPFIDFYYAGGRVQPGGWLIVDDTNLRACRVLIDFLRMESDRWRVHTELATTVAFERLEGPLIPDEGWRLQPWGSEPLSPDRSALATMRDTLRLRTRLRRMFGAGPPRR